MGKMLLIRHGESLANRAGIYQGQSVDTSLSPLGKRQARLVALRLKDEKVACVFTSPSKRTQETARIVLGDGGGMIIRDRRLLEINHGHWEGKSREVVRLTWHRLLEIWKNDPHKAQMPGGENLQDAAQRASCFVRDLESSYGNKTVIVVSHDVIIRVLICRVIGLPLSRLWSLELDNCSLSVFSFSGQPRVLTLNDTSHLGKFRSRVDRQAL